MDEQAQLEKKQEVSKEAAAKIETKEDLSVKVETFDLELGK